MPQYRLLKDKPELADIERVFLETEDWLTRRQVAELFGYTRNERISNMLEQLVADGVLETRNLALINGVSAICYRRAHNA